MLSASDKPPGTPSSMFSFPVTATESPTAARTAPYDLARETRPFGEASAPRILTLVEPRAEERAEQIAMAEMDLQRVEPGSCEQRGTSCEIGGDPIEIGFGRRTREPHRHRRENPGRRDPPACSRHRARMSELGAGRGADRVHRIYEPAQAGKRLLPKDKLPRRRPPFLRYGAERERRHACAARRDASMELDQRVGHFPAGGHPFKRCGLDDPVRSVRGPSRASGRGPPPHPVTEAGRRGKRAPF